MFYVHFEGPAQGIRGVRLTRLGPEAASETAPAGLAREIETKKDDAMTIPLRVLILETDHQCAESIAARLRETGLEPNWKRVSTEREYLAALDPPPDLILADNTSPHFSAHHARQSLRVRGLDVPFMTLSGTNGEKMANGHGKNGSGGHLSKASQWRLGSAVAHALEEMRLGHEKRRVERGGHDGEAWFRALVETIHDGISILDADGTIRYLSATGARLLGYSPDELVGKSASDLIHPDELGRFGRRFVRLLSRPGASAKAVHRVRHRDGSWRWLESSATNTLGEPPLSGIVHRFRDITKRKHAKHALRRAKQAAENANRARSDFLEGMGHDLRSPLNAVIGFTGVLLMNLSGPLNAEQARQLRTVEKSANKLLELINDVLDWNRIESGRLRPQPEPVVCQKVAAEVVASLQSLATIKGVRLAAELPAENVVIQADRRMVTDLLRDLVERAINCSSCGELQLRLERVATAGTASARFQIMGPGVDFEMEGLAQPSRPHEQDHEAKDPHPGEGLRMQLNRKLAHLLGGDLCLSTECGRVATLSLTLPEHTDGEHPGD